MRSKRIIGMMLAVLLSLAFAICVGAASESGVIQSYTLPREVLIQRVEDTVQSGQICYIDFYNIGQAFRKDLQRAATAATRWGGKVFINFVTLTGDEVTARVTVNPSLVKSNKGSLCFIVDTSAKTNENIKAQFEKLLGKPVAVMRCGQTEDFGMTVLISGKLDFSGLNQEKLIAYSYDRDENKYTEIKNAKCMVDDQGFVHLQTKKGGDIIIASVD